MGFYGNITNVNKSTFQFDKIYPNARDALENAKKDGIFVGRYILVDYDAELNMSSIFDAVQGNTELLETWGASDFLPAYKLYVYDDAEEAYLDGSENGVMQFNESYGFYAGKPFIVDGKMTLDDVPKYTSDQLAENNYLLVLGHIKKKNIIDEETSEIQESQINFDYNIAPELWVVKNDGGLHFERLDQLEISEKYQELSDLITNHYIENYEIDRAYFLNKSGGQSLGRGYDSTVWQKVIKNGEMTYVMIAELNSVVPTFDVTVDAPTPAPRAPYWDSDTSNLYYKLHVQPSWGMRIAKATHDENTTRAVDYDSDLTGNFYRNFSDSPTLEPLAIYWNQAGFDKFIPSEVNLDEKPNKILVENTGISGNRYWRGPGTTTTAPDTYELSIALPQIGNIISELWDLIYGTAREYDVLGNALWNKDLQAPVFAMPNNLMRNTNLEWNTHNGERAYKQWEDILDPLTNDVVGGKTVVTYNKDALDNLAGIINSAHDLMGMIIVEPNIENFNPANYDASNLDENSIYYINGKYYFKNKKYSISNGINGAAYSISGSNMVDLLDPNANTTYYEAKTFMLDKYTNEEKEYQNYYKVTAPLTESGVYGTLEPVSVEISPEPWQPANLLEIEQINVGDSNNQKFVIRYIPTVDEKPAKGKDYYTFFNSAAARVANMDKPVFYEESKYYIGKKIFTEAEIEHGDKDTWMNQTAVTAEDFDSLALGVGSTVRAALINAGITNEETIGHKWLKGVQLDPDMTRWTYVDVNSKKETISVDDLHLTKTYSTEDPETIVKIVYTAFGKEAELQNWKEATKDGNFVYEYFISVFRDRVGHIPDTMINPETNETILVNTLKTLKEWVEWEGINHPETPLDLVLEQDLQRVISEPAYTVSGATIIPDNKLIEFDENGASTYYVKHYVDGTFDLQEYRQLIRESFDADEMASENTEIYNLRDIHPIKAPIYYNVENDYYFKDEDNNFIRETATVLRGDQSVIENKYYTIENLIPLDGIPFIPNTYYYEENGEYKLAQTLDTSKTYYKYPGAFVYSDSNNIRAQGAQWNKYVEQVPNGVTLGRKDSSWQLTELPGFAEDIGTLHGLILKVNKMLLAGDVMTRDRATVQGAINTLNDIIDKFDVLKPEQFVTVDEYGRIHSAELIDEQSGTWRDFGHNTNTTGDIASGENWIAIDINPDKDQPVITITHENDNVTLTPTATVADKNTGSLPNNAPQGTESGINQNTDDTLKLYTPKVDSMGHIIGNNIETVTLPYGFKTIKVTNNTSIDDAASTILSAGQIADSTQDILTFSASNKWIKFDNNTEDTIKIGHAVNSINISDPDPAVITNQNTLIDSGNIDINDNPIFIVNDKINIPDWTYDAAGHITSKTKHEYILPYGFKTINADNNSSISAINTQDSLTFTNDNWISISVNNNNNINSIVINHENSNINNGSNRSVNDLYPNFGGSFTLEDWQFDDKGHEWHSSDVATHQIQMPKLSISDPQNNDNNHGDTIITGISLTETTSTGRSSSDGKAIGYTKDYVGNLLLTGYNNVNNGTSEDNITASNTINEAIKRLEYRINALDVSAPAETHHFIASISETDGKISVTPGTFGTVEGSIISTNSGTDRYVVTSVTINDSGKLNGTKIQLGTAALEAKEVFDLAGAAANVLGSNSNTWNNNKTVWGLKDYVDNLDISGKIVSYTDTNQQLQSATLANMLERIKALEVALEENHPSND